MSDQAPATTADPRQGVREQFARAIDQIYKGASPLYERLARGVVGDDLLLDLAANAPATTSEPNLLFAAVHRLLLGGAAHDVRTFYPSVAGPDVARGGDPFPAFRSFCIEKTAAMRQILTQRRIQTNEVRRSGLLLPALELAARQGGGRPLALLELGASAGLNLVLDRYNYDYGRGKRCGPSSPVAVNVSVRGLHHPPIPKKMPAIGTRLGVDLEPVRVYDPEGTLWLQACVWADQLQRLTQLRRALELAKEDPPQVIAGDALERLPVMLRTVPDDETLVVFHTHALHRASPEYREKVERLLVAHGKHRDLFRLAIEWVGTPTPQMELLSVVKGTVSRKLLAKCSGHGEWIEWAG